MDLGLKRIGLALCVDEKIALPLEGILRKNRIQAAKEIKKIILEYQISLLIVGVPKGGSCEELMQKRVKHFVSLLEFEGETVFVDESYTSKEALSLGAVKARKKDSRLDSLAALIMIKDYFAL